MAKATRIKSLLTAILLLGSALVWGGDCGVGNGGCGYSESTPKY